MEIIEGELNYYGVYFDDYCDDVEDNGMQEDESSYRYWSQICKSCRRKYIFVGVVFEDSPLTDTICGVKDCQNKSKYYINFIKENEHGE